MTVSFNRDKVVIKNKPGTSGSSWPTYHIWCVPIVICPCVVSLTLLLPSILKSFPLCACCVYGCSSLPATCFFFFIITCSAPEQVCCTCTLLPSPLHVPASFFVTWSGFPMLPPSSAHVCCCVSQRLFGLKSSLHLPHQSTMFSFLLSLFTAPTSHYFCPENTANYTTVLTVYFTGRLL